MIEVQIDMKFPKCCKECKFYEKDFDPLFGIFTEECHLEGSYILCDTSTSKPDWCKIKEVK